MSQTAETIRPRGQAGAPHAPIHFGPVLIALVTAMACAGLGCAEGRAPAGAKGESRLQRVTLAYRAYAADDCKAIEADFEAVELERWPPSEVRSAYHLVAGFCDERAGLPERARTRYDAIVRETPQSFSAHDARERLRILQRTADEADYAGMVERARERARHGSTKRQAIQRTPALYPPLAHHARLSGYAVVEYGVTPTGTTDAPVVVDSSPPLVFDGAALRAVRDWRYESDPSGNATARQAIRLMFKPDEGPPSTPVEDDEGRAPSGEG